MAQELIRALEVLGQDRENRFRLTCDCAYCPHAQVGHRRIFFFRFETLNEGGDCGVSFRTERRKRVCYCDHEVEFEIPRPGIAPEAACTFEAINEIWSRIPDG